MERSVLVYIVKWMEYMWNGRQTYCLRRYLCSSFSTHPFHCDHLDFSGLKQKNLQVPYFEEYMETGCWISVCDTLVANTHE